MKRALTLLVILLVGAVVLALCGLTSFLSLMFGRELRRRDAMQADLARLSRLDGLTGLANRRRFDEALSQEWRRAGREARPLSLLMIDVDRFKLYNDRYGHQQGDQCLRGVAATIAGCLYRPGDLAARYGGEEIAVLLPATHASGAADLAESILKAVEAAGIVHAGNPPGDVVTVSIGVATMNPRLSDIMGGGEELVADADAALYAAKHAGRNRFVVAGGRIVPSEWIPNGDQVVLPLAG